jgi:hypothetical protein
MSTTPIALAFASVGEAMDMARAALGYLAAADATQLAPRRRLSACGRWSGPTRPAPPSGRPGPRGLSPPIR